MSGERVWNFPFEEDYDADLESKVADIMQCAVEGKGDHILATRFLSRFVPAGHRPGRTSTSPPPRAAAGWRTSTTEVTGFGVRFALRAAAAAGPARRRWDSRAEHAAPHAPG